MFCLLFGSMEFKLRTLCFLGKPFTTLSYTAVLFALVIFLIESPIFSQTSLDHDSLIYASNTAGMTGVCTTMPSVIG
jgi:hypothetical protein